MVEGAGGPRFRFEAPDETGVGRASGNRLDRDVAAQPRVPGAIDLAHAARADQSVDFIRAEARAWRERVAHRRSF